MLKIDSQTNLDDIRKVVSKIGKEAVEFDIIWLNFIARRKIVFLVGEILKKYNKKYNSFSKFFHTFVWNSGYKSCKNDKKRLYYY